jgi:maltooligosyltrehalose synthase
VWQDTVVLLPDFDPSQQLINQFTGERLTPIEHQGQLALQLADVFANFPVALLVPSSDEPNSIAAE